MLLTPWHQACSVSIEGAVPGSHQLAAQVLSSALLALALYAWLSRPRVMGRPKPMESDPEALSEDEVCRCC